MSDISKSAREGFGACREPGLADGRVLEVVGGRMVLGRCVVRWWAGGLVGRDPFCIPQAG